VPSSRYAPSPEVVREVLDRSDREISVATAEKWCDRSVVAYRQYRKTRSIDWLLRAEDYRHEALEHAALVGDGGKLVGKLERLISPNRPKGLKSS
jgi:hypothetical protein